MPAPRAAELAMRDALYGWVKSCTDTRIVAGKGRASPLTGGRIPRRNARQCSRAPVKHEQPLASTYRPTLQVKGSLPGRVRSLAVRSDKPGAGKEWLSSSRLRR